MSAIPVHVPPELVRDFSYFTGPGMCPMRGGDPQGALAGLHDGPPVFYAPNNTYDGYGTWVFVRAEDQRRVLQDAETFSSHRRIFEKALGYDLPTIPLEIDPPEHGAYRSLLNPLLSPRRVMAMEAANRARAIELIEGLRDKGHCEVMEDFAFPFAVGVFLEFLGLPQSRRQEFLGWADKQFHGTPEERGEAIRTVIAFMGELVELRRREPADDFMTFVVQAQVNGRPMTDKEAIGMGALLFVAGLDTVAAAIGFDFRYLAEHSEAQARLRADPSGVTLAVEELLRAFPTVLMTRIAARDTEYDGIVIKAGDRVSCPSMVANRDPAEFTDPNRIDLSREDNRHVAFAYGPHRCLGSHLARRELVIAMEEWLRLIPTFRIREGTEPLTYGGHVFGIEDLQLEW
ncbi:cytochrome P450 [Sphingomonas jatrophae]|uniref:Cytochrome P450 n=1 Tax=Sphingomonas jatrophae TaxID=1166337 RepID=A0A1I6KCZ2_9SPHN|nr:cytochrome P450 [Sphingomonas jatrophae]SFR89113.1 Cytochrome P450 [Sphingomonas jatrophae]